MDLLTHWQHHFIMGVCDEPCSSDSGVNLIIREEGVTVETQAGVLNFIGADVCAKQVSSGVVNIYIPAPTYSDNYNEGSATVSTPSTSSRYVSSPNGHFDIGDWDAGSVRAVTRDTSLEYTMSNVCSLVNNATVFTAKVYGADGSTVLAQASVTLNGNTTYTSENISIVVSNWDSEYDQYVAQIDVLIDILSILPSGGRFSVELVHDNGSSGLFTKSHSNLFLDVESNVPTLTGVSITPTLGYIYTKFLSGIQYYTNPTRFTVSVADIDYLNDESYPSTQVQVGGYDYTLTDLNLAGSALTGWTTDWNSTNNSYEKADWTLLKDPERTVIVTSARIRARVNDWDWGSYAYSSSSGILVETHDDSSTRIIERFYDESWRCTSGSGLLDDKWDSVDAKSAGVWDSTVPVGVEDAIFINGGCERNVDDWGVYGPNADDQPDYTTTSGTVYLWREFQHDGSASSGFTLNVTGSYDSLHYKLAEEWDGTPSGGTVWIDGESDYSASEWNNGNPTGGTGGKTGSAHFTFGTNNIINAGNTLYLRMGFVNDQRITALNIVFD